MRNLRRSLALLLATALLALPGCRRTPVISTDVAVSIDGEQIAYSQFETYLRDQVEGEDLSFESGVQSHLFDQFLDGQLLIRLAIERGLVERDPASADPVAGDPAAAEAAAGDPAAPDPPGGAELDPADPGSGVASPAGSGIDLRRAIAFLLRGSLQQEWSEEEIAAYYEAHRENFRRPEEVHVRQILTYEQARAESALEALARGEDFAQVAARFSQGPKAHLGGDQGRLGREDLPPAFIDEIFALEPGEASGVVTADYGYLIFQVLTRYPAEMAPLPEIADRILQALRRRHVDEQVTGLIHEARARYNVQIFPNNFPFEYQGSYAD